jgi:hypothetical protein
MEGNDFFGGFQSVADNLSGHTDIDDDGVSIIGSQLPDRGEPIKEPPAEEDDDETNENNEDQLEDGQTEEEEDGDDEDTDEDTEDNNPDSSTSTKKTTKSSNSDDNDGDDSDDLGDSEPEIAEYIQEKIFERFGLEVGGENFKKFESIEDVSNFITDAINENSIPEFANEEVAHIDEYVRNGGDLSKYMTSVHGGINLDEVNIEDTETQKHLVREDLKNQGLPDTRIARKIERMEDTGVLAEEAEDALEALKDFKRNQEEKLLDDQRKLKEQYEEQNRAFVNSVQEELERMDNVRSIPITQGEKKKLLTYIFRPTTNGETEYQKEYKSNVRYLLESAYFTMEGDKLVSKVEKKAKSTAAKKLKTKLANKGSRGRNQSSHSSGSLDAWGMISKQLK